MSGPTLALPGSLCCRRMGDAWEDLVVGLAVLSTTWASRPPPSAPTAVSLPGHAEAGEAPARSSGAPDPQTDLVEAWSRWFSSHATLELYRCGLSATAVPGFRERWDGSTGLSRGPVRQPRVPSSSEATFPRADALLERARALELERQAPQPLIRGRHLIALGLTPARASGPSSPVFEAHLNGRSPAVRTARLRPGVSEPWEPRRGRKTDPGYCPPSLPSIFRPFTTISVRRAPVAAELASTDPALGTPPRASASPFQEVATGPRASGQFPGAQSS